MIIYEEIRRIEAIEGVVAVKRAGDYAVVILNREKLTGRDPVPMHIYDRTVILVDEGSEAHKTNRITLRMHDW